MSIGWNGCIAWQEDAAYTAEDLKEMAEVKG
jgi:hypothetical protein